MDVKTIVLLVTSTGTQSLRIPRYNVPRIGFPVRLEGHCRMWHLRFERCVTADIGLELTMPTWMSSLAKSQHVEGPRKP